MNPPLTVSAAAGHAEAILAISGLLDTLKLPHVFVGAVARAAWTGRPVEEGPVDVLAMLSPERMRQVPMMAGNRGFTVVAGELERAEELDVIPLRYREVRVHVLMATNALYGRMFPTAVEAGLGQSRIRVIAAEDLALLLFIAEDQEALDQLLACLPELDVRSIHEKLTSIGVSQRTINR